MVIVICEYCKEPFEAKRKSRIVCDKKGCKNKYHAKKNKEKFNKHPEKREQHNNNQKEYDEEHTIERTKREIKNQRNRQYYGDNITKAEYQLDSNVGCKHHVCEECGTEYYPDFKIEPVYRHSKLLDERTLIKQNVTPWGAGICPKCGLTERHLIDEDIWEYYQKHLPMSSNIEQKQEWREDLNKIKYESYIKLEAKYTNTEKSLYIKNGQLFYRTNKTYIPANIKDLQLDFIEELKSLRYLLNTLKVGNNKKEKEILTTDNDEQICWKALNDNIRKNKIVLNR